MAKLSVIVPIYNVEKYLRKCLDSVINQTFKDMEIILVDDGSPDRCGEICDEYAARDNRIRVIHKENGGLPSARNDAIEIATGEWIAFVDSDDWLEPDIYEKAVEAGDKYNVDILFFNYFKNIEEKEFGISIFEKDFFSDDRNYINSLQARALCKFLNPIKENGYEFPWNRILRQKFIMNNNLYFTKVGAYEDLIYAINCFQYAERIAFIDVKGYHYRLNNTSISAGYNPNRIVVDNAVFEELFRLAQVYHADESYYTALYSFIVCNVAVNITRYFFNRNNKNSLVHKMRYAASVIKEEPYYTAFERVDRSLLTKGGRFITIIRHHNVILLYICYLCKLIKGKMRNMSKRK